MKQERFDSSFAKVELTEMPNGKERILVTELPLYGE